MKVGRFGLPAEVRFCRTCVISNQRPSSTVEFRAGLEEKKETIHFNEEGICDACIFAIQKDDQIDWEEREKKLFALSDRLSSHKGYNIVVPGSGGKDSAFTSHILKYKYGFRPLTVTWAPHLYTEIGRQNFDSWVHDGGLDNILFTPNGRLHRHLTRLAFLNLLHPFQPFIVGQRIIGPLMAMKFDVPAVFYGENQAEYGNKISQNETPLMDERFFSVSDPRDMTFGGRSMGAILSDEPNFKLEDFLPYIPPTPGQIAQSKLEVHYLGYYLKWDPQECFYYAAENTGFKPNPERTEGTYSKYSSIDDKIDPFHYYTTLAKFGLGRASYDAAQEIRNGKILRDEGVALVKKFDGEFPAKYFPEFLDYVSVAEGEFHGIVDSFRPDHLWEKRKSEWRLKKPVWEYESD